MRRALAAAAILFASTEAEAAVCNGRPTDAGGFAGYSYDAAEAKFFDGTKVRVHYTTSGQHAPDQATTRGDGVPDTVAFAAQTGDDALATYAQMGFLVPPDDASCSSNGGDAKLDIYLVKFAGADGTTTPEACNGSICASFVLSDSTFVGRGYKTPQEGFQTVITHELFHTVQNAYDKDLDRFWAEGTAQWAMKTLHPDLPDFENQLPAFFSEPNRSIDSAPSGVTAGYLYGAAIWPLFLSTRHGEDVVKLTLEAEKRGKTSLPAVDEVLQSEGSSLAAEFPLFWAWNVATKKLAGTGGYPNAAKYPGVKTTELSDGETGITSGFGAFTYHLAVDGPKSVSLETDAARNGGVLVPIVNGVPALDQAKALPANVETEAIVVVAGITSKKTDAPFTVHLGAPTAEETPDAGVPPASTTSSSGGCTTAAAESRPSWMWLTGLVALFFLRKKRR